MAMLLFGVRAKAHPAGWRLCRHGTTVRTRVPASIPRTNVYFHRELLTTTPENRRIELLTVTSYEGIRNEREPRIDGLFPSKTPRAHKFKGKTVGLLARLRVDEGWALTHTLFCSTCRACTSVHEFTLQKPLPATCCMVCSTSCFAVTIPEPLHCADGVCSRSCR